MKRLVPSPGGLGKKVRFAVLAALSLPAAASLQADSALHSFKRLVLSEQFFSEGACFADVDGDGAQDVVSGPYWYAGPDFRKRYAYAPAAPLDIRNYSDFFFSFAHDFNGDGHADILAIGMPGRMAHWYENPGGKEGDWRKRAAIDDVGNESPEFIDLTGDGRPELVCCRGGAFGYAEPDPGKPGAAWRFTAITPARGYGGFTHGLGVGDVDGDGRLDLLETNGWWRQGVKKGELFEFNPVRFARSGGAQMYAYDFDGDGDNDVLSVQNAHGYGLTWFEQVIDADGKRKFLENSIITSRPADSSYGLSISQMHAVALVDIDGDGVRDIVTGKRFWAHAGGDTGSQQLPVLYWFKTIRSPAGLSFEPWLIDERSGVGTQVVVGDISGNGHPDIVVGSKMGTYLMLHEARQVTAGQYERARPKRRKEMAHTPGTHLFASHVRATGPRTPLSELDSFTLPEGFEVQLFASEPQINKPLNIAFDTRGRLWVSNTLEYPYPVGLEKKGRDSIRILEDTDSDGRSDKVTTFADGLNIPMGLYPYGDGVICFSIPNIWYLRDTDGDGRADRRQKLYGPLGYERDTHGLCNSFTRGLDGWLYACHGFNNVTELAGTDGNRIRLRSGNVFRMRLDGSRVERFSNGQVNPFGLAFDRFGDFFSADCHTKPVSLLLKDGYHESFGAPHDGVGFVPGIMDHNHGSTAICGIVLGSSTAFGELYADSVFGGNVTTCRINRNTLVRNGSSLRAREEPDFLVSGDPWFRPVYLQAGPDGALYVADFYNKIIGHYEVPLDHPGRDRHRGRIWRISYKGSGSRRDVPVSATGRVSGGGLHRLPVEKLVEELGSRLLSRRGLALDELERRPAAEVVRALRQRLRGDGGLSRAYVFHALGRLGVLGEADLAGAVSDQDPVVRVHAQRLLAEIPLAGEKYSALILSGFKDPDPMVRRAAVQAASNSPGQSFIRPLLGLHQSTPGGDAHLYHSIRIALRNHLRNTEWFRKLAAQKLSDPEVGLVLSLCLALKNRGAGEYIVGHLDRLSFFPTDRIGEYLRFAARYIPESSISPVVAFAREKFKGSRQFQGELIESVRQGLQERGVAIPASVRSWELELAKGYLDAGAEVLAGRISWEYLPHPAAPRQENPWQFSARDSFKVRLPPAPPGSPVLSSFPTGERKVGIYRSGPFTLPKKFSFWMAGHDKHPGEPLGGNNFVRLRDALSHVGLRQAPPPRSDSLKLVEWDTVAEAGHRVYVELVDGNAEGAYAWIAVGGFSVAGLSPSRVAEDTRKGAGLIGAWGLSELRPALVSLLENPALDYTLRGELAAELARLSPDARLLALARVATMADVSELSKKQALKIIAGGDVEDALGVLESVMKVASAPGQRRIAVELATDRGGAAALVSLVEGGKAGAGLLRLPAVSQNLAAVTDDAQREKIKELVGELPPESERFAGILEKRKREYILRAGRLGPGREIFQKTCSACHRVGGEGREYAPNLDGVGNRGLDRLIEDILDPNRNVDVAFRSTTIVTRKGQVYSGLPRPTDGKRVVLIDSQGREISVPLDSVARRTPSRLSPMPANFSETLGEEQFRDMLSYLLSLRSS